MVLKFRPTRSADEPDTIAALADGVSVLAYSEATLPLGGN